MGLNVEDLEKIVGKDNMPIEVHELDEDNFLKVKETLTRIGTCITDNNSKTLFQISHILHKKGKYYITHYKQMYMFDGKISNTELTEIDVMRNKYIAKMLRDWGLIKLVNDESIVYDTLIKLDIKIVKFSESRQWKLKPKYFNTYKQYSGNK